MGSISITVNINLESKNPPNPARKPTIWKRTLRHLTEKSKHPGKIVPVYIEIEGDYKVFGAFTFNTGGSISFFPDVENLTEFDHITIVEEFISKGGHFTLVGQGGEHSKVVNFDAPKLDSGDYHLMTFIMEDGSMLNDLHPTIEVDEIELEEEKETLYMQILNEALQNEAAGLKFPDGQGVFCVQILATTRGVKKEDVRIFTKPIVDFLVNVDELSGSIKARKLELDMPNNADYKLYISCFRVLGKPKEKMCIAVGKNKGKSKE